MFVGKETLVPLTPSVSQRFVLCRTLGEFYPDLLFLFLLQLYVPGRLTQTDSVLLDIGTGYFAETVNSISYGDLSQFMTY